MSRLKYPDSNPLLLQQCIPIDQSFLVLQQDVVSLKKKLVHTKGAIFVVQLSSNKRFIAIGGDRCKLEIWHNKTKKLITSIHFRYRIMDLKFSIDDLSIYVAFPETLIEINMLQGFMIWRQYTFSQLDFAGHNDHYIGRGIKNINMFDQKLILLWYGKSIFISNQLNNKLKPVFKLNDQIQSFDYFNDLCTVICSSNYCYLSLYLNSQLFIQQKIYLKNELDQYVCQYEIKQLRFLGNLNIIGSINTDLMIWCIDHRKKQFHQIHKIMQTNYRFSFNMELSPQMLILIYGQIILVYKLQIQMQQIKELSMCRLIKIKSEENCFPQRPYVLQTIG